ncbi:MAG: ABC transporter ATP-binding protein [Bdellovibrionaceae bacterium]|nr:ABC transporter ATP-binding protein [Bdellovibrionales bacterium]MCB9253711.1 ABC transporter ATP-binding protein [Pseudobdellovibrionaceae bacterium]
METAAILTKQIRHEYGKRLALEGLSLEIPTGTVFGLIGPNGSGKSTAFKILSTQMLPSSGDLEILGLPIAAVGEIRKRMGVVFQSPALDKKLGVAENLRIQGWLYGLSGKLLEERIVAVLEHLGVRDRSGDKVESLSGGLQRRVEIAKALLHKPRLLILDEPTTGLDANIRRDLLNYFRKLRDDDGMTILFTTHYLEEAEACDRVALLEGGKLVAYDTPRSLTASMQQEILTITAAGAAALQQEIQKESGLQLQLVGEELRAEGHEAHKRVAWIMERWGERIDSLRVGRPTLEDYFIKKTGQRYEGREGSHV